MDIVDTCVNVRDGVVVTVDEKNMRAWHGRRSVAHITFALNHIVCVWYACVGV